MQNISIYNERHKNQCKTMMSNEFVAIISVIFVVIINDIK